jgi:hypothetical protein
MNPVFLFMKSLGELWLSSWKSSPEDTAAAVKGTIDVGSAAATGSRLFSFLNASLSSGMMGITMLTMAVTTTLAAVSVTYDVFINEESNLQVQIAEFDSGVITDESGNILQNIEIESAPQAALTTQGSFVELLQAVIEPKPEFTIVSWEPEVDERFLVIEPDVTVPVITPEPDAENIPDNAGTDISDTPSIPVNRDSTPVITTMPPVTAAPLIEDAMSPEVTTAPPEVTTAPPEVTTAPPEVTTAPPEVTTTPPEVTTTPPAVTTTPPEIIITSPITTPPPPVTTTTPPQPPVKSDQTGFEINALTETLTYGGAPVTLTTAGGQSTGAVTWAVINGTAVSIALETGVITIESAGTVTVAATKAGNNNYNEISAELIITVGKRDLSVAVINAPPGTYTYTGLAHTPSPNVADGASPNLITNADYTYSHGANISAGVGAGSITVTATAGGNYTGARTIYFDIEKAPLTVTADDKEKEFSEQTPTFTATITDFVNNEALSVVSGNPEFETDYNNGDSRGEYEIRVSAGTLSADNYYFAAFVPGTLSVGLTVQDAFSITGVPSPVTFGDAGFTLGTSGGSGTGAVTWAVTSGTAVSVNPASGSVTVLEAGTAVVRATKAGDNNYSETTATLTLTVNKAEPVFTEPAGLAADFGDSLSSVSLPSGWAWNNPASLVGNAGAQAHSATFTPGDTLNFNTAAVNLTVNVSRINQSALTINEPGAKTFGDSSFALSVSGGTTGAAVTFERMAGSSLSVATNGNVTIEGAGETRVRATMAGDNNYNEISAELVIAVGKRDLSVAVINAPPGTYTYTGLAHTPSPNVADGASPNLITNADYTYSHGANINAGAGAGSITVTATAGGNYTGTRTVYFDIEKAPLTVTANDDEIEFGAAPPQFTYIISGFVNGENRTSASITGEPSLTSAYTQGMAVGHYTITAAIGSLSALNYDFTTFINGTLSVGLIAQDALSITGVPSPVTFGDAGFTLGTSGGSGTGAVTWAVTSGTAVSVNPASGSVTVLEAGTAVVRATKAGDDEFRYAYVETTLTVEAKSILGLSIIVNSLPYNGTPRSPYVTITGLEQGIDFSYSFMPQTNAGIYNFDITGIGNYTGVVNEEFIITPAQLTIEATFRNDAFNPSILTPLERYIAYDIIVSGDIFGTDSITLGSSNALLESSVPVSVTNAVRTGIFTLGYDGITAVPTGEISTNLTITNTANYVFSAATSSVSVPVIDGQHADRPIPVTNSTLRHFNNYARGSDYPAGGQGRHYKLTENVSITAFTWMSIGNDAVPFTGTFDGQGFVISGMVRTNLGNSDVGIFGVIGTSGEVRNIGLANINVTGMNNIGGIAGRNSGLIENCFVSGVISGENYVGGIVGSNNGVLQNNVSLLTSVTATLGDTNTARVAGSNSGGTLSGNYARADMLVNAALRTGTANDINGADITTATLADANNNLAVFATKTPSNRPDLEDYIVSPVAVSGGINGGFDNLEQALAAITTAGTGSYTVTLNADQTLPSTRTIGAGFNITFVGAGQERRISYGFSGANVRLLEINGAGASLTLGNNIRLQGQVSGGVITVANGTLTMLDGSLITGSNVNGGNDRAAVIVQVNGTFNMNGGKIIDNTGGDLITATTAVNRINLNNDAQIGEIRLNNTSASIAIGDNWTGTVSTFSIRGAQAVETVIANYTNTIRQVLTGSINPTTLSQFSIGNGQFHGNPGNQLIRDTHIIGTDGRLILIPGTGSPSDPWLIRTAEDLLAMGRGANHKGNGAWALSSHYLLMNNITLTGTGNWTPIGGNTAATGFTGTFDGGGYSIMGLNVAGAGNPHQGMFRFINGGTVRNLELVNVAVSGTTNSGGIAGQIANGANIFNCSVINATITGTSFQIGGIVGLMTGNSNVYNCFSSGTVSSGGGGVGGIVGTAGDGSALISGGTITRNISTATVSAPGQNAIGGIVGNQGNNADVAATITHNIALNASVTGGNAGANPVGRVVSNSTFATPANRNNNYSFVGMAGSTAQFNEKTHEGKDGADIISANYVILWVFLGFTDPWWQVPGRLPDLSQFLPPPTGSGTASDPWRIYTVDDLLAMGRGNLHNGGTWGLTADNGNYLLMNDIDLAHLGQNNFTPIGGLTAVGPASRFTGSFNGQGYDISGLDMRFGGTPDMADYGFFVGLGTNARIENINFINANVMTNANAASTGGVAANIAGTNITVRNVHFQGNVTSNSSRTGGLIGSLGGSIDGATTATIERNSFVGDIRGTGSTGGIIGFLGNNPGVATLIQDNFTAGNFSGAGGPGMGGILGHVDPGANYNSVAVITRNLSTMSVVGTNDVGGIVGQGTPNSNVNTLITISYNAALNPNIDGTTNIGRVVGGIGIGTILNRNKALSSMQILGSIGGEHNSTHGESVDLNEFQNIDIWTDPTRLNWDFVTIWEWDAVNLRPKLRGQPQW